MLGSPVSERRFKADSDLEPGTRLCRLCFTIVVLKPAYIEVTERYVCVRCPHCGHPFPIRRSDLQSMEASETIDSKVAD